MKALSEQIRCTVQIKYPRLARDPEIKPQHASGFPADPADLTLSEVFPYIISISTR